jgi:hypothetical protein
MVVLFKGMTLRSFAGGSQKSATGQPTVFFWLTTNFKLTAHFPQ